MLLILLRFVTAKTNKTSEKNIFLLEKRKKSIIV